MDAVLVYGNEPITFYDVSEEDYIGNLLLQGRWWELSNLEFIRSLNLRGTYVDVGAYIGTSSLFFSKFCPSTKVYSFEPCRDSYRRLITNLERNGAANVDTFNVALSSEAGSGHIRQSLTNGGGSQLVAGNDVEVRTLDSFDLNNIQVLKIDVEGMELQVLQGAVKTLTSVEHLFVEMWDENNAKRNGKAWQYPPIMEFLESHGFELREKLKEDLYYFRALHV